MRKYLIILLIILPYSFLQAQNTTNSPTSKFGIGEIAYGEGGQYAGMGGAGIALRSGTFINYANPAAISALDSARFIVDMGLKGAYRIYRQTGSNSNSIVGNLNNLSIGFRMKPYLFASIFVSPVSSCGYAVTLKNEVIGGVTGSSASSLYEGTGGLSKAGISGAYLWKDKLSIGASAAFVSGTITQTETQSSAAEEIKSRKQSFYLDLGAQYLIKNKHHNLTIGAVYGLAQPLHQKNTLTASSSSGGTSVSKNGTIKKQYLPAYYGIGASYTLNDRWLFTADYRYYDWSKTESELSYIKYENQNCIMLGAQRLLGNLYTRPIKALLGAGVSNSYVVISNKKAENFYVSGGFNFLFRGNSTLSFGLKYNDQFNSDKNMQRDRSLSVFLNVTFNERVSHIKIQ